MSNDETQIRAHITPSVLRWARKRAKVTQDAAASMAGQSLETYQQWESGQAMPSVAQAKILASYLDISYITLFRLYPPKPRWLQVWPLDALFSTKTPTNNV